MHEALEVLNGNFTYIIGVNDIKLLQNLPIIVLLAKGKRITNFIQIIILMKLQFILLKIPFVKFF